MKRAPEGVGALAWTGSLIVLSFLPDLDVVGFALGIPYSAPFGHRGALHSPAFAAGVALVLAGMALWRGLPVRPLAIAGGLVVATHGLLDTLTDGGLGIALLWPFSTERHFAPWRPIPVAPIGPRLFLPDGLRLMAYEALLFLPVWFLAAWPAALKRMARWGDLWFCVGVLVVDVALRPRAAIWWVGMALAAAAIPMWIAARRQLGSAFSIEARAETLVTHGIYARIRHPIYLFGSLAYIGALLALQIWPLLIAWLALTPIELVRVRREERVLESHFGEDYRRYRSATWF